MYSIHTPANPNSSVPMIEKSVPISEITQICIILVKIFRILLRFDYLFNEVSQSY